MPGDNNDSGIDGGGPVADGDGGGAPTVMGPQDGGVGVANAGLTGDGAPAPEQRIAELEAALAAAQKQIEGLRRRWSIERTLASSGAIDAASTAGLIEAALSSHVTASDAEVQKAVAMLRTRRPALFGRAIERPSGGAKASAMSGTVRGTAASPLETTAQRAALGDRGDLMAYLRARRGVR